MDEETEINEETGMMTEETGMVLPDASTIRWLEDMIGEKVFIHTVTLYYTGYVVAVSDREVVLMGCAWIPSTGRWGNTVVKGTESVREVEPYREDDQLHVNREAMVTWFEWKHPLPREQKG